VGENYIVMEYIDGEPVETAAETMTAIIREEPEPLPGSVPAPLRWTIDRLLAKDREEPGLRVAGDPSGWKIAGAAGSLTRRSALSRLLSQAR
jgi:hypothetical protein